MSGGREIGRVALALQRYGQNEDPRRKRKLTTGD
jgi:hypothetical protein